VLVPVKFELLTVSCEKFPNSNREPVLLMMLLVKVLPRVLTLWSVLEDKFEFPIVDSRIVLLTRVELTIDDRSMVLSTAVLFHMVLFVSVVLNMVVLMLVDLIIVELLKMEPTLVELVKNELFACDELLNVMGPKSVTNPLVFAPLDAL